MKKSLLALLILIRSCQEVIGQEGGQRGRKRKRGESGFPIFMIARPYKDASETLQTSQYLKISLQTLSMRSIRRELPVNAA